MRNIVNRALVAKKNKFLSNGTSKAGRVWQLLMTMIFLFTLGIGQMWADAVAYTATTGGTTTTGETVKIHTNADTETSIAKFANSCIANGVLTNYWKISGSFKAGDEISFTGVYSSSSAKTTAIAIYTSDKTQLFKSASCINGRTSAADPEVQTYTLEDDYEELYIGRDGSTGTYLLSFSITRSSGGGSDPVDPTASFSNGDYTIGGSDLDLSSLFTTNSDGAVTYTITNQGTTDAALRADGKSFYATVAGSATVKVEQAATSSYKAYDATATITVAACETSISGQPSNASLKVGDANPTLSITAANVAAYAWKESSDGTSYDGSSTLSTSDSYTPSVNDAVQIKYYYCEVTSSCSGSAVVKSNIVTVEVEAADPPCAELVPATSGDAPAAGGAISLSTATGGSMKALTTNISYTANGLLFGSSSSTKAEVTLNHLMQVGTVITATIYNDNNDKARGLNLLNSSGTSKATWTKTQTGDHVETYTVVAGDGLAGSNVFQLQRNNNAYLKSITVSNCGAELFALSSAIDPVAAEGKATITLSKTLVASGATATATYSAIDAAYDFDEWVVSGATIDDAHANPVTITMGSTDATITLKLKAASVKYAVHFDSKGGSAVADQLVEAGEHASVPTAPTKFKYTFGGWSETDGGSTPADLSAIAINAEKTFYAIWTPKACPTSGTIYSFVSDGTKAPSSNTYCPASGVKGVADIAAYATVSGGLAQGVHTTTSNNPIQIQTSTSAVKLSHADGYFRALLECPLQEGDTIKFEKTNKVKMAFDSLRTKVVEIASGTGANKDYYIVPATYAGEDTIMVYYGGSSVNLTALRVIRPAKFDVTFNMHGYGDAVDPQSITEGGKVTKPSDPTASGWDFGGWFKESTYDNEWDFANDVVNAATEIHAKWTEHAYSHDATLSSLSYTIGGGDPIAIALVSEQYAYAVELPMGTDIDAPVIAAVANDPNRKALDIVQTNLGQATVTVTAEDNTTIQSYAITFSVADHKDIQLVFKTGTTPCVGSASTASQILSNNAAVSTYINQITFTNVEGAGDDGAEGSSLNVGKKAGNMFTLSAKPGFAMKSMNFLAKIQDATCEYSIDGGAWTELASTNTGGDECYAPFASGTVHEFRLRSTGNSGVWIRNMQLTMIEACTPVAITWDEEPVEFEVGKEGQVIAATANNGGTIAYGSSAPLVIAVDAVNGLLSVSDLGSATLSASTAEGDGTTYCANGGADIILSKVVNTYYLVKFDAQNGDAAAEVKFYSGDAAIALPAAPSYPGFNFQGWFDAETGGNQYTEAITPSASITVYAQWVAQCAGATITTQPVGASYLTGRTPAALVCEATAGAGGALSYEWFSCDDDQKTNPVAATATPSTAVAGTFYYFCKVMEAGCDVEAFSDVVTITVADKDPICLAWVDVTGQNAASLDASKSLYAPEVSAAGIKNSSSYGGKTGWKFNSSPGYVAIEGAPFKAGDIVEMFVTTVTADKARVFNANEAVAANVVAEGAANMVQGANKVALTADANNLYLRRGDDFGGWNPYVAYIAVNRVCAPILNKMTVAGVDGTPDNTNHVAIEVPFTTTQTQLEAIAYDWISNNAAWDADPANAPVATNAWEFGVENTVTFADKDGDESVYYVTISKAAASSDATLSALTVNGQAIALEDGVFEYSFELPYGTTVAPTVVATPNHVAAVATVDPCTVSGATITVVPEVGESEKQVYTLTFTIAKWKEIVVWDGSTMTAVETSPNAETGLAWAATGFGSIGSYTTTYGEKSYSKYLPSGGAATSRYMTLTVPAGYVAKFYVVMASHSDGSERGMFIGSNLVKDPDATSVLQLSNNDRDIAVAGMSEIVGAGTWYINPNASIDFQEIRVYLRKGMVRNSMLGNGVLGTSCVDHNVAIEDIQGATFYELMGREPEYGKLAFDEIVSGELEAGVPYVFQANGDKLILFYGETKVDEPVDKGNGMYGTFVDQTLTELDGIYYFAQRALWSCVDLTSLSLPANRAYVKLSEIDYISDPNPAPGRRRVLMAVNGEAPAVTTGIENAQMDNAPVKMIINGQLFILRGEKMFDATGRLVK